MPAITVLTESDIRSAVGFGSGELEAVEAVYLMISDGIASMPPIMRIDVPEHHGEIDIKSAYLPGYPGIAVKVSAGFFDNPDRGLPSLGGLMMVFDTETGVPRSALFDNGYLTDLRTGLAGAVAAKHLARSNVTVVAVLGAGAQAAMQLEALLLVRKIEEARVWARRPEQASVFAAEMTQRLGITVEAQRSPHEAIAGAGIVVTATPATSPIVDASMLHSGLHVTAVGSDAETKQELALDVVTGADRFVADSVPQSRRLGELRSASHEGAVPASVAELGDVISGKAPGRTAVDAVTVCDLTGTGAQDTAIASLAVERCADLGAGVAIET